MEVEICIDQNLKTAKAIIHTPIITDEVSKVAAAIAGDRPNFIYGYRDESVFLLEPQDIYRIYALQTKVIARLFEEQVYLKARLYELENNLVLSSFIRISGSELVNINQIKSLDMSLTGTIGLTLKNGDKTFVSRRNVEKIKEHLGL